MQLPYYMALNITAIYLVATAKQKVEYNFRIIICDCLLTRGHNVNDE
jgi:hypothetical protein